MVPDENKTLVASLASATCGWKPAARPLPHARKESQLWSPLLSCTCLQPCHTMHEQQPLCRMMQHSPHTSMPNTCNFRTTAQDTTACEHINP